ncbi:MAG: hypothetical protein EAZ92_14350, partial [Candidatus Kapaibacterium sp.]
YASNYTPPSGAASAKIEYISGADYTTNMKLWQLKGKEYKGYCYINSEGLRNKADFECFINFALITTRFPKSQRRRQRAAHKGFLRNKMKGWRAELYVSPFLVLPCFHDRINSYVLRDFPAYFFLHHFP